MIESSTSAGRDHHQVRELVDHAEDVRKRRLAARRAVAVELDQRTRPRERHDPVALLHLAHEVHQRVRGHPRVRDHRRQQVRDRVVVVQLDLLRIDQHEPDLVRARAQQDADEHRVDGGGLARAGRAGDEQVRHLREIGADRAPRDVLAEPDRQRRPLRRRLLEDVAESHDAPLRVRHLDADRLLARDRREDPHVGRRERVREVVLERRDLRHLRPWREPQLVARDVRPGDRTDYVRGDAEVPERLDQPRGHLGLPRRVGARLLAGRAREQADRRQAPLEARVIGHGGAVAPHRRERRLLDLGQDELLGGLFFYWLRPFGLRPEDKRPERSILVSLVELAGESVLIDRRRGVEARGAQDQLLVERLRRAHRLRDRRGALATQVRDRHRREPCRRVGDPLARRAQHHRERAAAQQHDAGEEEEDREEVRAEGADQVRHRPQLALTDDPAALLEIGRLPVARADGAGRGSRACRRRARASSTRRGGPGSRAAGAGCRSGVAARGSSRRRRARAVPRRAPCRRATRGPARGRCRRSPRSSARRARSP